MRLIIRTIFLFVSSVVIFQNRFRIMNVILGNTVLRKNLVAVAMQMPFLRNRFMRQFI